MEFIRIKKDMYPHRVHSCVNISVFMLELTSKSGLRLQFIVSKIDFKRNTSTDSSCDKQIMNRI